MFNQFEPKLPPAKNADSDSDGSESGSEFQPSSGSEKSEDEFMPDSKSFWIFERVF